MPTKTSSIPVANQPAIIGELTPGAFIRASYIYEHKNGIPEKNSICRWIISGVSTAPTTKLDLLITPGMAGKTIRLSITPVSEDNEQGLETYSTEHQVKTGFQNISDAESNNSFIKQHGYFSIYSNEPRDRIFIPSSGAFSLMNGRTQSILTKGKSEFGGAPPPELVEYLKNNPAIKLFSTANDFCAQVPVLGSTTRLILWGSNTHTVPPSLDLNNIKFVYSNSAAFAFIYDNPPPGKNTIGAFGNTSKGGEVPESIQRALLFDKPKAIYATESAFAVLTEGANVYSWGNKDNGGVISDSVRIHLDRIKVSQIISSAGAFCAIGTERFGDPSVQSIVTWGNSNSGGFLNPTDIEEILDQDGVKQVVANRDAFCAITKRRSKAISWGSGANGGSMSDAAKQLSARGSIVMCKGSAYAFCMVNTFGDAEAWGVTSMGGTTPTAGNDADHVVDAGEVFNASGEKPRIAAMFKAMKIDDWYQRSLVEHDEECICPTSTDLGYSKLITTSGTITLGSNDTSFFLLSQHPDGRTNDLFAWGNSGFGGSIPSATRQVLLASRIKNMYCTNGSFAVISDQGNVEGAVNAFGGTSAQNEAGEIPDALRNYLSSGVQQLYSIKQMPPATPSSIRLQAAFSGRRSDGDYVIWGARTLVTNEVISISS